MQEKLSVHGSWANRWVFILAATGSAVGLGNIWKFPYIAGYNGGGAFVLAYLACIVLVGMPIMIAEVVIGRRGRRSPINAMRDAAKDSARSHYWALVGGLGALAGVMIFSFYSVVAGWVFHYILGMWQGAYIDIGSTMAEREFALLLADPERLLQWHSLFIVLVSVVLAGGVMKGLERATRLMMPTLFLLLFMLLIYAATTGAFLKSARFLFSFDATKLTVDALLMALGHAFFTLSLGMGAIMAYGAYMPSRAKIGRTVVTIAVLDTFIALAAGMVIFPIVFANGLDPQAGVGLMFITLPVAFGQIPGGQVLGCLFFLLIGVAALTSAISLLEPAVAWLVEQFHYSRRKAAYSLGFIAWVMGLVALGSFNVIADMTLMSMRVFDFLDFITANIMLPLSGFLVCIFAGWKMKRALLEQELAFSKRWVFTAWYYAVKFVAPIAVAAIFVVNLYNKLAI